VGVAAFFTGVMRAPVTGIVLVTEMTGNVAMLLPMLGVSFVAMLVPTLVRKPTNLPLVTRAYAAPRNDKPDESRKEQGGDQE
jgi:H+/Cl- antiporter ClcA